MIVADARPIIALAKSSSLNALLIPGVMVIIPDIVMYALHADKSLFTMIQEWINDNFIRVVSTEEYREFKIISKVKPDTKIGYRQERAAGELLDRALQKGTDEIMLLFDESYFEIHQNYIRPFPRNVRPVSISMLIEAQKSRHQVLLEFSQGLLTKEQTIDAVGVRDYAELLPLLGDANIPLPSLPKEELDKQVEEFVVLFKKS